MVTLNPIKDNTLYSEIGGPQSDGMGQYLRVGRSGETTTPVNLRRGLVKFDIAASVPAGSTIDAVTLTLFRSNTGSAFNNENITLQRVTADWGEGASVSNVGGGGRGATALAGDTTWTQRFFGAAPPQPWSVSGGDFIADVSTERTVSVQVSTEVTPFTWPSTSRFVADVQGFLDNPASNFGWIIRGDEVNTKSAVRFTSRNHTNSVQRPVLTITFTPSPPPRLIGDVDNDKDVERTDIAMMALHFGKTGTGDTPFDFGDFNKDNTVSIIDLAMAQQHLGQTTGKNVPVPEPNTMALLALGLAMVSKIGWARNGRRRTEHFLATAA
jgi:hypothetical protein